MRIVITIKKKILYGAQGNEDKINSDAYFLIHKDTTERHSRIPYLEQLYKQKQMLLEKFQKGEDIWKYNN